MIFVKDERFAKYILYQRLWTRHAEVGPREDAFLLDGGSVNLALALLVGFHLCLEHAVALFACMQNAESFLAVRNDESLVLPDGCCDDEQRGNDDAHQ